MKDPVYVELKSMKEKVSILEREREELYPGESYRKRLH